jgi:hypothetical protein
MGWCQLTFEVYQNTVSVSAASVSSGEGALASFQVIVSPDQRSGHFGFVKFGHAAMAFTEVKLSVHLIKNSYH